MPMDCVHNGAQFLAADPECHGRCVDLCSFPPAALSQPGLVRGWDVAVSPVLCISASRLSLWVKQEGIPPSGPFACPLPRDQLCVWALLLGQWCVIFSCLWARNGGCFLGRKGNSMIPGWVVGREQVRRQGILPCALCSLTVTQRRACLPVSVSSSVKWAENMYVGVGDGITCAQ